MRAGGEERGGTATGTGPAGDGRIWRRRLSLRCVVAGIGDHVRELGRCSSSLSTNWAAVRLRGPRGGHLDHGRARRARIHRPRAHLWASDDERGLRATHCGGGTGSAITRLRALLVAHPAQHARHEAGAPGKGRDAAMADHVLLPRVVGGQRERQVSLEGVEHGAQVAGPRVDVLVGVVGIAHAHEGGGRGHELHEALGALLGDRGVIEVGLTEITAVMSSSGRRWRCAAALMWSGMAARSYLGAAGSSTVTAGSISLVVRSITSDAFHGCSQREQHVRARTRRRARAAGRATPALPVGK